MLVSYIDLNILVTIIFKPQSLPVAYIINTSSIKYLNATATVNICWDTFILYLIFVLFWRVKAYPLNYRGLTVIKKIPLAAVQCGSPSKSCSVSWNWVQKVQRTATRCVPATSVGTHVSIFSYMWGGWKADSFVTAASKGLLDFMPINLDTWQGQYIFSQGVFSILKQFCSTKLLNFCVSLPVCMYQFHNRLTEFHGIRCWVGLINTVGNFKSC